MGNRRSILAAAGALIALAAAAPAHGALSPPTVFSEARQGDLRVFSSVLVSRTAADMRGGWLNEAVGCDQWRRLRVRILVAFTPAGSSSTQIARKRRTGVVQNCAEGGPNMGFTVGARSLGFGCANGRWRAGQYDFVTTTRHFATGLLSAASVGWRVRGAC